MPSVVRNTYTAVIARGEAWSGAVATEPYEAAWASEAVFFVRALEARGKGPNGQARVQISPDGMNWVDEGTKIRMPAKPGEVTFGRVANFGGWLRLVAQVPAKAGLKVVATLALKA